MSYIKQFYGLKNISVNFLVTTWFSVIINLARRICQVSLGQGQILFHIIEIVAQKERNYPSKSIHALCS